MRKIKWFVTCLKVPTITRHCKKCNVDTEFSCSERFRINAQGKYLDVWLIYNCKKCKTSWNSTILSRIHTNKLDADLLALFQENDLTLSKKYGTDKATLKKNGVVIQSIEYQVLGDLFELDEEVAVTIQTEYPLDIKLFTILKEKLSLSNNELHHLIAKGKIVGSSNRLFKEKLQNQHTVLFNPKKESKIA
ncbi:DUF1062 domain-containing protein [Enterococcus sp.]|uniref:DUF1062 domain-containing protein n=1 Tax=Enterococcus sp. TaxID=35783 RepID=UPI0039773168